jgi:hypothetical protein
MSNLVGTSTASSGARAGFYSGQFALEIGGQNAGFLLSVEGGEAVGEVVVTRQGVDPIARKHIGAVRYEDVTIRADLSLSPLFFTWLGDTLQLKNQFRNVSVVTLEADGKVRERVEYDNALIKEITFAALDGTSKESWSMEVTFSPEITRTKAGDGSKYKLPARSAKKKALASNFRLTIDGLDCSRVTKVDAFTIEQTISQTGPGRGAARLPGQVEISNLVVTLAEISARSFSDWHTSFVINGNNAAGAEKKGTLSLLSPDLRTALAEINFTNLGISRLSHGKREAGSTQLQTMRAELYAEQIELVVKG